MIAPVKQSLNQQILEEASTWFIEFREGHLSPDAREAFTQWLRRSPEHIRAYLEISETYVRLPSSDAVPPSETERLIAHIEFRIQDGVVPLDERVARAPLMPSGPAAPTHPAAGRSARTTPWRSLSIAASLLILLGSAVAGYLWTQRGLYTTSVGEERTVTLEDASRIELNARTRLRVTYSKSTREIQLLDGQALFQVAKDPARPFIVRSGDATVRAVGTQFDVYRKESGTTVTVLEGRVAVYSSVYAELSGSVSKNAASQPLPRALPGDSSSSSQSSLSPAADHSEAPADAPDFAPRSSSGSAAIFLSAGEQLTVSREGLLAVTPHATNVSAATAWTRGQLEFQETPLSEVADEFSRASGRRLVIEDAKLRDFKISGVYSSVDPASLILFLRNQPDMEVSETGSEIEVRARNR